jgi:hypothetical protein
VLTPANSVDEAEYNSVAERFVAAAGLEAGAQATTAAVATAVQAQLV